MSYKRKLRPVPPLTQIELPGLEPIYRGKVRDIYQVSDKHFLMVASDRLSAFDVVFPVGITDKGKILTRISNHWFSLIDVVPNHLRETHCLNFPEPFSKYCHILEDRSCLVRKCQRIDVECVVRGYLMGSAYEEYQKHQKVAGEPMPSSLAPGAKLPYAVFSPAIKKNKGHDENISFAELKKIIGEELAQKLRDISLSIYHLASKLLETKGILLLDTKFEFGFYNEKLILIDELLTPDSSRYCLAEDYEKALKEKKFPPTLDKQIIRDYLIQMGWRGQSPIPPLPEEILEKTRQRYQFMEETILCLTKPT
ncbi:MAG: phosphoribosylaminoimidazolesuccinocarboxamide synthase [Leptospiraceae bacterium]|nr:phosphoribosylaminoimidazolesuccinocarboxamide synthase [Leptospiraceae bacterium]MDW8306604.1 phosphoribosylaminoimidazolesuccinocarboxamide synthase [Leptospiraceae bacterium]